MTRTIELSDFADDIVLQLVALPLDKDICISLHVSAGSDLEESIACAVAQKVALEIGGCVSMSCGVLPADLSEDSQQEIVDISMNLAKNLVSKLKMKQE